jgi:hypothetical protein
MMKQLCSIFMIWTLVLSVSSASLNENYHRRLSKRALNLIPTLTVDVGASGASNTPVAIHQDNLIEYKFAVGEVFNLSCVIKHPSHKYRIAITREHLFSNGSKSEPTDLLDKLSLEPNPELKDDRFATEDYEFVGALDPTARHLRVSLIIKDLDIKDNGLYKCSYYQLVKQIKVVVYSKFFFCYLFFLNIF